MAHASDDMTALEIARAVRMGEFSAVETCDAAIARIDARNDAINAVVVCDFDRARAAAAAIDSARLKDDPRPLLGVPMTVKESNDVAGLPTTWGFEHFRDFRPAEDSVAVARIKAAGAIILGKSNAPVALADWQSVNPIYGRTVNPHDPARSPGGSSGGAAAALASGMVPLEVGSDIGGSIRVPAHMCGVYGHKPTYGVVPLKGHGFPGTDGADPPLAVVGPMARSADDLAAALRVLAGPLHSPGWSLDLPAPRTASLKQARVLVLEEHPAAAVDDSVRAPIAALAQSLRDEGAQVMDYHDDAPDLAKAHEAYVKMLLSVTTRGAPGAAPVNAHEWLELIDAQMRFARQWRAVFADVDVVLTPAFGAPAFPHDDRPDWASRSLKINGAPTPYGAQLAWACIATFGQLPATVAPIARTAEGLPVGVQIIAGAFRDYDSIAFAAALQRAGLAH